MKNKWDELDEDEKRMLNPKRELEERKKKRMEEQKAWDEKIRLGQGKRVEEINQNLDSITQERIAKLLAEKSDVPPELGSLYDKLIEKTRTFIRSSELLKQPGISDRDWNDYNQSVLNAEMEINNIRGDIALQNIQRRASSHEPIQMPEEKVVPESKGVPKKVVPGREIHE
jgi:hypothetical protein